MICIYHVIQFKDNIILIKCKGFKHKEYYEDYNNCSENVKIVKFMFDFMKERFCSNDEKIFQALLKYFALLSHYN